MGATTCLVTRHRVTTSGAFHVVAVKHGPRPPQLRADSAYAATGHVELLGRFARRRVQQGAQRQSYGATGSQVGRQGMTLGCRQRRSRRQGSPAAPSTRNRIPTKPHTKSARIIPLELRTKTSDLPSEWDVHTYHVEYGYSDGAWVLRGEETVTDPDLSFK